MSAANKSKDDTGSARAAALAVLTRVERDRSYSNLLLNQTLQKSKLDRADAALATEIVYGTIQRLNTIDYFLCRFVTKGLTALEPWVRSLLRLSFYQLYYLERIPNHAAVNEAVNLAKAKGHAGIAGMVNGVLRNVIRRKAELQIPEDLSPVQRLSLAYSHPEWMVARWLKQYGPEAAEAICKANNAAPQTSIRVNTLRHTREQLLAELHQDGLEAVPSGLAPAGIILSGGGNPALSARYALGDYTIQDESSMLAAEALAPQQGMQVLDCCAAPGGKTTQLAEKMANSGAVYAVDVHEHKEKLIREQAVRLGLTNIHTMVSDARKLAAHFDAGTFDAILLDAPCSGLGVIRRKPDLKWTKSESDVEQICAVQASLLAAVHPLLKPGGILVYSTCTIDFAENAEMVERFLQAEPRFRLAPFPDTLQRNDALAGVPADRKRIGMLQLLPQDFHSDGFFIARLQG